MSSCVIYSDLRETNLLAAAQRIREISFNSAVDQFFIIFFLLLFLFSQFLSYF